MKGEKMGDKVEKSNEIKFSKRVMKVVDLASYQKDAVVSRTLIDKKAGTVTFFAFDEGQGLSEHTAPFDALISIVDGEAEISISGIPLHLEGGDAIIMPANESHALKARKKFKMILIMIKS